MLKTDLERIKGIACTFLYCTVKNTIIPEIVKHPFTDSAFVCIPFEGNAKIIDISKDDEREEIELWRKHMKDVINNSDSAIEIMNLITKSYKLVAFKHFSSFLSPEDYGRLLKSVWTTAEAPNVDPNFTIVKLLNLFKKADKNHLMSKEELDAFNNLPEKIVVYRGIQSKSATPKALSWTISFDTASFFANRFDEEGKVFSALIPKEYVLAYFLDRGEYEVVLDPRYLTNITKEN